MSRWCQWLLLRWIRLESYFLPDDWHGWLGKKHMARGGGVGGGMQPDIPLRAYMVSGALEWFRSI